MEELGHFLAKVSEVFVEIESVVEGEVFAESEGKFSECLCLEVFDHHHTTPAE